MSMSSQAKMHAKPCIYYVLTFWNCDKQTYRNKPQCIMFQWVKACNNVYGTKNKLEYHLAIDKLQGANTEKIMVNE